MHKDRNLESFSAVCLDAHKHMCLVAYTVDWVVLLTWSGVKGATRAAWGDSGGWGRGGAVNAASNKERLGFFPLVLEKAAVLSLRTCEWNCALLFFYVYVGTHILCNAAYRRQPKLRARCTEEKQHHRGCDNKLDIRCKRQWWPS